MDNTHTHTHAAVFRLKLGFKFHHAKPEYVMMNQWLPEEEENTLPTYATHNIGKTYMHTHTHAHTTHTQSILYVTKSTQLTFFCEP